MPNDDAPRLPATEDARVTAIQRGILELGVHYSIDTFAAQDIAYLLDIIREQADVIASLRHALKHLGRHTESCASWPEGPWRERDRKLCSCGFADALASPEAPTP